MAPCPCHDDTGFSLLIAEEPQGMPELHCLACCCSKSLLAPASAAQAPHLDSFLPPAKVAHGHVDLSPTPPYYGTLRWHCVWDC